jgi:YVTN family beta-propeller protein
LEIGGIRPTLAGSVRHGSRVLPGNEIVLEFHILGPFEVVEQARPVVLGGPKQRALLAILLLRRGQVVTSDRLIDELWGERPPATAAKTLQGYVWHLRKALGNDVLVTRGGGYVLVTAPGQVDAEQFEALVADGRRALADGDVAGARERLGSALELWRGEALADLAYDPFAQGEIARLEDARLAAVEDRIEADLLLGHHRGLVGELEGLVGRHPHRERLLGQLMLALYRSGRQADALEVYRQGRQTLSDELGLESGHELRALEQRILTHDTELEAPMPVGPPRSVTGPRRPPRGRALIAAGGALLLLAAAITASIVAVSGGGNIGLRPVPNSVAAIDTRTNRVVGQVAVGARPSGIAFASGSLWVANLDDQSISRVDPRTLRILRTLSVSGPPTGIAAAGGRVWVVASNATATYVSVSRIDPLFDAIAPTARIANIVPGSPGAVAARGATVWVAPSSGPLARLDPRTGRVAMRLDPNAGPTGIALGADAVWVTDSEANNVTRVDPTGLVTAQAVGHGPSGIAVGKSAVWVADTRDNTLIRIDPNTKAQTSTIPVGRSPAGVSLGAGSVWVANAGDGTVMRIDPVTEKVIATIPVGGSPQAITIAGGRAWVSVDTLTIPTGPAAGGGTARLVSQPDVDSMDPAVAYNGLSQGLLYATCAKLLNYPDKSGAPGSQLVPEVAQSLPTRSADGRSYTFTIRPGFRFSPPSTETVTAQTFKATIERSLNPRMKSPVASEFGDIVGARAYMAGKTAHIAGVIARGNTLTIRLVAPAPDLLSRTAEPALCAVPSDTPVDPQGVRVIPSAGPYRVASYTPGQGVVLTRNPNYGGSRPHRLARIELTVGISDQRAVAQVEAGTADYLADGSVPKEDAGTLAVRYGPGSPAAKRGRQQYFVNAGPQLDLFALNTHRPLFADPRLRRAANYAIDRARLARLGDEYAPLPEPPTDHYLPPGLPGYAKLHIYPFSPDVAKARRLAAGRARTTAVLYTCNIAPCDQQAQIVKTDLAAIGIRLTVKAFTDGTLYAKTATPGEPFDIAWLGWLPDYPDPNAILNPLLEAGTLIPTLNDPRYRARIAAAGRLTGTKRYLTYARLDADLTRNAAPFVAFGNSSSHDLFSARIGCQVFTFYGVDLANLCIR